MTKLSLLVLTISNTEILPLARTIDSILKISLSSPCVLLQARLIFSQPSHEAEELVATYSSQLDIRVISTSDSGISHALNIGLQYAELNDAIYTHFLFLHAGDVFSAPSHFNTVIKQISLYKADIYAGYYGSIKKGKSFQRSYPFNISTISGINHWGFIQTILTSSLVRFDHKYSVAMDYDYILNLLRKGVVLREYDDFLVEADPFGLSQRFNACIKKELDEIYRYHFYQEGFTYTFLQLLRRMKAIAKPFNFLF